MMAMGSTKFRLDNDTKLLDEVLGLDKLSAFQQATFDDIQAKTVDRGYPMTDKQRNYCLRMLGRDAECIEEYENLVSEGKAPRGREVASMVGHLPLRPPGRK